jgi:hypothetical protein
MNGGVAPEELLQCNMGNLRSRLLVPTAFFDGMTTATRPRR